MIKRHREKKGKQKPIDKPFHKIVRKFTKLNERRVRDRRKRKNATHQVTSRNNILNFMQMIFAELICKFLDILLVFVGIRLIPLLLVFFFNFILEFIYGVFFVSVCMCVCCSQT